jgi:DNA-binding SARP family transcriptional activator
LLGQVSAMSIPKLILRLQSTVIPDVFHHPLWLNYIEKNYDPSPELIQDLLDSAHQCEQKGDILCCCQTLMLCAYLQRNINEFDKALDSLQKVWELAEDHRRKRIMLWATWGTWINYLYMNNLDAAKRQLNKMQRILKEDDWVLASVIDVIKEEILKTGQDIDLLKSIYWINDFEIPRAESITASDKSVTDNFYLTKALSRYLRKRIFEISQIVKHTVSKLVNYPLFDRQEHQKKPLISFLKKEHRGITRSSKSRKDGQTNAPKLETFCLGSFLVYQDGSLIEKWPSGKGKSIFRYMILHENHSVPRDILMDVFWRDSEPESARNNLNVAMYGLREALRTVRSDYDHIQFINNQYLINPELSLWVDVEEFLQSYKIGWRLMSENYTNEAVREFEKAINLYKGDLFEEDLYDDWSILKREELKDNYLQILNQVSRYYLDVNYASCASLCQKILAKDNCREDAHRRLMKCYSRQNQRNLALRQYQQCLEILKSELDVEPSQATKNLFMELKRGHRI